MRVAIFWIQKIPTDGGGNGNSQQWKFEIYRTSHISNVFCGFNNFNFLFLSQRFCWAFRRFLFFFCHSLWYFVLASRNPGFMLCFRAYSLFLALFFSLFIISTSDSIITSYLFIFSKGFLGVCADFGFQVVFWWLHRYLIGSNTLHSSCYRPYWLKKRPS